MTQGLDRPVALVTGASRGLGAAIAADLAAAGYLVVGVARDSLALDRQVTAIGRDGFRPLVADLTDVAELDSVIATVRREVGDPRVLVNNAGYGGPYALLHETADAQWAQVMAITKHGGGFLAGHFHGVLGNGGAQNIVEPGDAF